MNRRDLLRRSELNTDIFISSSLLGCDLSNIQREVRRVEEAGTDWVHFDVMDGVFVPNISFGLPVQQAVKRVSDVPIDTHLMIVDPIRYIEDFAKAGSDIITFHVESTKDPVRVIEKIHQCGVKAGISIKPVTPIGVIRDLIPLVDMVLIMTVEPGFGGQGFIQETLKKISMVREIVDKLGKDIYIEVDGGINDKTAPECRRAGANVFVSGTYIFNASDCAAAMHSIRGF